MKTYQLTREDNLGLAIMGRNKKPKKNDIVICTACVKHTTKRKSVPLPCSHRYCHPCVKQMVAVSLEVGGNFPPRCCNTEIPFRKATYKRILGNPLLREVEKELRKRIDSLPTYCSSESCNEYIAPSNVLYYGANCPCGQRTCIRCKHEMHRGQCKLAAFEDKKFLELAARKRWKRCPNCGATVERDGGCNHVV